MASVPRLGRAATHVLTTLRKFPSLEPVNIQPVSTEVLGLPTRRDILWQAVVFERDADRAGSRVIVGRSDGPHSRRKILPQKGSGKARMGDRNNPIRMDGARAHGRPAPVAWATKLNNAVYAKALRTALSMQHRAGRLYVLENNAELPNPNTYTGQNFIKQHHMEKLSVTIITSRLRPNALSALEDCANVDIIPQELVSVRDILHARRVLIEKPALEYIAARTMAGVAGSGEYQPGPVLRDLAAEGDNDLDEIQFLSAEQAEQGEQAELDEQAASEIRTTA